MLFTSQALREQFIPNKSYLRTFEPEGGLLKSSACFTLCSTSQKILAAGLPRSEWGHPLQHMLLVYHLAPNTVLLIGQGGIDISQHWPGAAVDKCTISLNRYEPHIPAPDSKDADQFRKVQQLGFYGLTDTVAGAWL